MMGEFVTNVKQQELGICITMDLNQTHSLPTSYRGMILEWLEDVAISICLVERQEMAVPL